MRGQRVNTEDSVWVERVLQSGDTTTLYYARQLLGRPYVGHTLEVNDSERLVVNTRQLDCTTLVETVAALTLCARNGKSDYKSYRHYLQQLRYRQGHLDGYPSRLHYFSDWIDDNAAMGLLSDVATNEPPFTAVQTLSVNYMSQHPEAYKALRKNPSLTAQIAAQEKKLTGRKYRYIPKQQVADYELLRKKVNDGDIIAITTSKRGLDIAHLGFAVWRDDGLHLLNASQLHKKVVEEPMRMHEYLAKHPTFTGIRVVRLASVF
jgi:hypothetical protein